MQFLEWDNKVILNLESWILNLESGEEGQEGEALTRKTRKKIFRVKPFFRTKPWESGNGGCGGGFFLACENFGRMFDHSFPVSAFWFFFVLFLKWRLAHAHLFHSLCQNQSTVAQRAETAVAECSLASCVWARFRNDSYTMPKQRHTYSDFTGSRMYVCLGVTCHLHFWQYDRGPLRATAFTRGWNGKSMKAQNSVVTNITDFAKFKTKFEILQNQSHWYFSWNFYFYGRVKSI